MPYAGSTFLPVFKMCQMLATFPPMFKMCQTWFDSCVCYPLCCLCDISCVPFLSGDDLIDYISTKFIFKKKKGGRKKEYKYLWKPILPYPSWDIVAWPSCLSFCSLWENGILSVSFGGCGVTSLQSALPGMGSRFLWVCWKLRKKSSFYLPISSMCLLFSFQKWWYRIGIAVVIFLDGCCFSCPDPAVYHCEEEGHPQILGWHLCVRENYHYPRGK